MLAPDTILQNRYQIVRLLAQGGMGAVYEARDQRLGNIVALKETFFADEQMRHAFHREASLLATLRHQALPRVIDHFNEGNGQFLVMEFIRGDDLAKILELHNRPLPPLDVLQWGDQLLGALEYLHAQQTPIIHRDIKPQNLKLNERGEVILLDFGLAKGRAGDAEKSSLSVRGYTLNYAPLEQIQGEGTDPRSDLYSVGATLYHLLTNVAPPDAVTRASALVHGQPDPLRLANEINPQIPPQMAGALHQAMAQDRNRRFASAAVFRAALRHGANEIASPAAMPGATQTPRNNPETVALPSAPATAPNSVAPPQSVPVAATSGSVQKRGKWLWLAGGGAVLLLALSGLLMFWPGADNKAKQTAVAKDETTVPEIEDATQLKAGEIIARGSTEDQYYAFTATPGEITLSLNVIASGAGLTAEILDSEKKPMRFMNGGSSFSVSSSGQDEQAMARLLNDREQPLLVHLKTSYPKEIQAFRLRLGGAGAARLAGAAATGTDAGPLAAMFAERDQPRALTASEIFAGQSSDKDAYYVFTAGPGEVGFTQNVVADGAGVTIELFDDNAEEVRFSDGATKFSVSSSKHNEQHRAALVLDRTQKLLLRLTTPYPKSIQAYRLKFTGPIQLAQADSSDTGTAVAQALNPLFADRDNPLRLPAKELSGRTIEKDTYYAFTAGPGELTFALSVEAAGTGITLELFDEGAREMRFDDNSTNLSVSSSGKPEEKSAKLVLDRAQPLLLRLTCNYPDSLKSYRIQIGGAVRADN